MSVQRLGTTLFSIPFAIATVMVWNTNPDLVYAQAKGMEAPPSKVEIIIKNRQHGYETAGFTMPSQDTIIVVRNQDSVTHGLASTLFKNIAVKVEGGTEVRGKQFKSFHVDAGKTMTLRFSTAPSNFDPQTGGAESVRHVLWCDIHPEVKGELFVIETRGDIGGG
ncbi:MAG: hypothetical protein OEV01_08890 [Nitrospira sp.]|nr:hypothetical protein [Nitrospira sp.]MDH4303248.1 hypothetical protein [Nitrospira sp.]MDH5193518.1 hypothetical protein [Nitrospira sp.]